MQLVFVTSTPFAPKQKERFYQQKGRPAEPSSPELAGFISRCLTYEPVERPSFRTVLRELPRIGALLTVSVKFFGSLPWCLLKTFFLPIDTYISPSEKLPDADPSVFHKRYLKMLRVLGEVSSTASWPIVSSSCTMNSDSLLLVLSPGSLWEGDSLQV